MSDRQRNNDETDDIVWQDDDFGEPLIIVSKNSCTEKKLPPRESILLDPCSYISNQVDLADYIFCEDEVVITGNDSSHTSLPPLPNPTQIPTPFKVLVVSDDTTGRVIPNKGISAAKKYGVSIKTGKPIVEIETLSNSRRHLPHNADAKNDLADPRDHKIAIAHKISSKEETNFIKPRPDTNESIIIANSSNFSSTFSTLPEYDRSARNDKNAHEIIQSSVLSSASLLLNENNERFVEMGRQTDDLRGATETNLESSINISSINNATNLGPERSMTFAGALPKQCRNAIILPPSVPSFISKTDLANDVNIAVISATSTQSISRIGTSNTSPRIHDSCSEFRILKKKTILLYQHLCTACGKKGHSFERCRYVTEDHPNVNWDRTVEFEQSKMGRLYYEKFRERTLDNRKREIVARAPYLLDYTPCTACGKDNHTFEKCRFVMEDSRHCNVNWNRSIPFSESDMGRFYNRMCGKKFLLNSEKFDELDSDYEEWTDRIIGNSSQSSLISTPSEVTSSMDGAKMSVSWQESSRRERINQRFDDKICASELCDQNAKSLESSKRLRDSIATDQSNGLPAIQDTAASPVIHAETTIPCILCGGKYHFLLNCPERDQTSVENLSSSDHCFPIYSTKNRRNDAVNAGRAQNTNNGELPEKDRRKKYLLNHRPCTACGKYNHSFEECGFISKNHPNVNLDRTVNFAKSRIGKCYIETTKYNSLQMSKRLPDLLDGDAESIPDRSLCTACGKGGHSFEQCRFTSEGHPNVNWDSNISFLDSPMGRMYAAKTNMTSLKKAVEFLVLDDRPCTACGKANHTFEECELVAQVYSTVNWDRSTAFGELKVGKVHSQKTRKKSLQPCLTLLNLAGKEGDDNEGGGRRSSSSPTYSLGTVCERGSNTFEVAECVKSDYANVNLKQTVEFADSYMEKRCLSKKLRLDHTAVTTRQQVEEKSDRTLQHDLEGGDDLLHSRKRRRKLCERLAGSLESDRPQSLRRGRAEITQSESRAPRALVQNALNPTVSESPKGIIGESSIRGDDKRVEVGETDSDGNEIYRDSILIKRFRFDTDPNSIPFPASSNQCGAGSVIAGSVENGGSVSFSTLMEKSSLSPDCPATLMEHEEPSGPAIDFAGFQAVQIRRDALSELLKSKQMFNR